MRDLEEENQHLRDKIAGLERQAAMNLELAEELGRALERTRAELDRYKTDATAAAVQDERARSAAKARLHRRDLSPAARRRTIEKAIELGVLDEDEGQALLADLRPS